MSLHDTRCKKQLQAWLTTPRARLLVQRESALLRTVLAPLTGYRLLQVGSWGFARDVLRRSGTLCQWRLGYWSGGDDDIAFDGIHLPIASASVDALLLAHSLELCAQPHVLLRECERVLNDRGQLVVLSFNPLSMWALSQRLPGRAQYRLAPGAQFYAAHRVCDWLRLLDFEPQRLVRYGVGFPFFSHTITAPSIERPSRMTSIAWLAQAYLVVARKRVVPLTRIRWRDKKAVKAHAGKIGLANHGAGRVDSRR